MAVIDYTINNVDSNVRIVTWTPMANSDTGTPYVAPQFSDASVQVHIPSGGAFGAGGNVRIQGTNESSAPENWATLNDPQGNALDFTMARIEAILEHVYQYRPNITAGDGTTSLTVRIMFMHIGSRWKAQE